MPSEEIVKVYVKRGKLYGLFWSQTASSDKDPMYLFCPKEENTWCKFHEAVLKNKELTHGNTAPFAEMLAMKIIFKICPILIYGGVVLKVKPKGVIKFAALEILSKTIGRDKEVAEIDVSISTIIFNDGSNRIIELMKHLVLSISKCSIKIFDN